MVPDLYTKTIRPNEVNALSTLKYSVLNIMGRVKRHGVYSRAYTCVRGGERVHARYARTHA
jgi:hypothetical protein